ncbi:MAG: PKD domain-containing protein, partial [Candidatus Wallbacteria bacterium]|nr:PKD domain-containing protein [Candidatus Wallbacteria bacterium]
MTRPALALLLALCLTLAAAPPAHAVLGDVDGSGRIDGVDLILLSRALGAARGQARFLDDGDLDGDGRITDRDLAIVRANFARSSRDPNVWVADTGNNRLVKLNVSTGRQMLTVPLPAPGRLALDSAAGEIWAVSDRETLVRVTSAGRVAARFGGFGAIRDLAIDTREGQVYALDTNLGRIFRIPRESAGVPDAPALASVPGSALTSIDTSPGGQFLSIAADGVRGALWALGSNSRLLRIAADAPPNALSLDVPVTVFNGSVQATGRLALDPLDGSVVVTDQRLLLTRESGSVVLEHRVTRIPAGNAGELFSGGRGIGNFSGPGAVVVNAFDSSAWIADQPAGSAVLVKLDSRGREILRLRGFRGPVALSIDPLTGALWAADTGLDRVTKISPSGVRILELGGFSRPSDVAAAPGDTVKGAPIVSGVANPEAVPVGAPVELSGVAASLVSTIVRYEWDFDGNGSFDYSSPSSASTTHTYSREGIYTAILRVTDAQQLSSVDYSTVVRVGSLRVTLDIEPRSARGTAFARLVANSFSPLTGRIENVQFDFDGDGQFESFQATDSTSVEAFRLYNQPGSFRPAVKVVDPSGSTAQA